MSDAEDILKRLGRHEAERPEAESACLDAGELAALRDGRLGDAAREAAEAHLAECERCVDHLLSLTQGAPRLSERALGRVLEETRPPRRVTAPWWGIAGVGVAVAAALVLTVGRPAPVGVAPEGWQVGLAGGVADVRGAEPAAAPETLPRYTPDSDLVVRLVPAHVGGPLPDVWLYLDGPDGRFTALAHPDTIETDDTTGVIESRSRAGRVLGERYGRHELRVLVLAPGAPAPETLAPDEVPPASQVLKVAFVYERAGSPQ